MVRITHPFSGIDETFPEVVIWIDIFSKHDKHTFSSALSRFGTLMDFFKHFVQNEYPQFGHPTYKLIIELEIRSTMLK